MAAASAPTEAMVATQPADRGTANQTVIDGRYRILHQLASGGMGTVFLGEHLLIKRRVAIKMLHPNLASDTGMVKRFMNEALAAGTLGHPNIVESTDMGFLGNRVPFIVFEYLEGALLSEEIFRLGGIDVPRALRIAKQIASALDAAHNAGIVHLDLKTDNVFLTDKDGGLDHVKVLDFGISRFMEAAPDKSQHGMVIGTPEFMAPEQATTPDTVDKRADVYALGVVLYEMLSGRLPYTGNDARVLLYRICNEAPAPLDCTGVPAELEQLLFGKLMAKDREHRLQTMPEVIAALSAIEHQLLAPIPPPVEPVLPSLPVVAPVPVAPQRGKTLLLAAIAAALAAGGFRYAHARVTSSTNEAAIAALRVDADKIVAILDSEARAAQLRAHGIATLPMLRAAIETDPATLRDMARSEALFMPARHEVLELFQHRKGAPRSLVRIPETARPLEIHSASRIANVDDTVRIIVHEPVTKQDGTLGGTFVLSMPVDLSLIRRLLVEDALEAHLTGLGADIALARSDEDLADGSTVAIPIAIDPQLFAGKLDLRAVIQPVQHGRTYDKASMAAAGTSALLFLAFGMMWLGSRPRRPVLRPTLRPAL